MHRPAVVYRFDDVILNPKTFSVEKSGAIGKEELLSHVWEDVAVSDNALSRVVAQLRKGLGDDAKTARYIETVPTVGYRFVADVVEPHGRGSKPSRARQQAVP